ncbi:hypothetical protein M9H77_12555 [Catharanthus roseus]|uniref:Uncharacterized protein n=1 Tax=Catharanthus roseus TaxID=4058 RepID=A0ACC0BHU9_CATRO|nr:hypothetical protein M9H77_12555 [Catharanthus roseus]
MYNLSTTSASKVYANINIHEVNAYETRKTISELFHIVSDANPEVEKCYTCKVIVLSIDMNNDFYYKSSIVCYRKLMEIESKFYFVVRYMLNVLAGIEIISAWFILFDKEIEKVIGYNIKTVVELYLEDGWASNTLKLIMNDLISHRFVFEVKLNNYNIQRGSQRFTVS